MKGFSRLMGVVMLTATLSACSMVAPKYNTNFDNVDKLRSAKLEPVTVGAFATGEKGDDVNRLTIRGSSYKSPNGSYTAYLQEAVRQELDDARLLDPKSQVELSGVLVRNELDGSGISTGFAEIEARFVVKRDGKIRFDKVKTARHEWDSAFLGSIAIPRAQQNYPIVVQKLLASLYVDLEFLQALKK
ncbi:MAG TPA: hypothetical protein PK620_11885 [Denitromonas sp.]|uniref:hypothetical protein n=1 Tax=Denitromonas sp. TaxID=2734609 RepID=UPI001DC3944C|nr:hypothetical protein [Rhodocyclaceae bacterium]MCP5222907.1 hypothetical protein [Zoogloeaceae bacterium]HPR05472.1 hypothetical protein [Denitromonas sp.]HQU89393.1 hypothetical protein [Denitromonas sp.]HQV15610.1 hypothetical protein [Denitromonas sp.]